MVSFDTSSTDCKTGKVTIGLHCIDEVLMSFVVGFNCFQKKWETLSPRKSLALHQYHANPFSPLQNIFLNTLDIVSA